MIEKLPSETHDSDLLSSGQVRSRMTAALSKLTREQIITEPAVAVTFTDQQMIDFLKNHPFSDRSL